MRLKKYEISVKVYFNILPTTLTIICLSTMSLLVNETFYSLLGESIYAGEPAFFIRLTGCNLRCKYCDTPYAFEEGEKMSVAELVKAARASRATQVLVTGGEPLLQPATVRLLDRLLAAGFTVMVETNGSLPIHQVSDEVYRIVDIKCPSSEMSRHNYWANLEVLTVRDQVKFVISDQDDFIWALAVIKGYHLLARAPVLISPVFGKVEPKDAATWILNSRLPLRLNLQLHKYIWGPEARGV